MAELQARHPALARRTLQRWISQGIAKQLIANQGAGRARRYLPMATVASAALGVVPANVAVSADSQDILTYVSQPLQARKPVGYQRDFLDACQHVVDFG